MEMPPLLAQHAIDGAIGGFFVGFAVQGYPDRKTAGYIVPDDLDAANGLAAGPLPNGLEALLSESAVAQSERCRLCQMKRPTADTAKPCQFIRFARMRAGSIFDMQKPPGLAGRFLHFLNR
jgi:hypothetical protein